MVLINFSEVEQNQEVNLPSSELAKPPDIPYEEPLTVQMLADGTILFGGDKMDSQGLGSALLTEAQIIRAHAEKKLSDVTVVIRADKEAKTGEVQKIIQKSQNYQRYTIMYFSYPQCGGVCQFLDPNSQLENFKM